MNVNNDIKELKEKQNKCISHSASTSNEETRTIWFRSSWIKNKVYMISQTRADKYGRWDANTEIIAPFHLACTRLYDRDKVRQSIAVRWRVSSHLAEAV